MWWVNWAWSALMDWKIVTMLRFFLLPIYFQHSLGSFSYFLRLNWAEIFKKQHIKKKLEWQKINTTLQKKRNQVYACLLCDTLTKSIGVPVLFVSSRWRGNTVGSNFLWTSFQTFGQPICSDVTKFFRRGLSKLRTSNLRMCELFLRQSARKTNLSVKLPYESVKFKKSRLESEA